jgi:hypothetical protein
LSGKFKKRKKRKSIVNDTNIIAYILYKPAWFYCVYFIYP